MNILALLPGLLALIVAWRKSPAWAFVAVYIPSLLLIPDYYQWIAPGVPDPNFHQSAILVVAALHFWQRRTWQFSVTDFLVCGFAFSVGYSQFLATTYWDAQNLIFTMLCSAILPYAVGKSLIEQEGMRVPVAKTVVLILSLIACLSVYEFRFMRNPFQEVLGPFFPGMGDGWVTTIRWGFGRVAGPYAHAILAGIIFAAGFRLQRWLQSGDHWGTRQKDLWKARSLTFLMLLGMVFTLSRGPWIGSLLGATAGTIGRARNRQVAAVLLILLIFAVVTPTYFAFKAYVDVDRDEAASNTQETAAYRKELFERYFEIALQRKTWGWGQTSVPKIPGLASVDNYWLLLALMHGLVALGFFCSLFVASTIRLSRFGFRTRSLSDDGRLAFDLVGILLMYLFSITTVFLGTQTQPLLFLVVGWGEGVLARGPAHQTVTPRLMPQRPPFQFARVMA